MNRLLARKLRREAWQMRGRILLLTVVVIMGVALSTTLLSAYGNLRASYDDMYASNKLADLSITTDEPRLAPDSPAAALGGAGMQDIAVAMGRLSFEGTLDLDEDKKARLVGIPHLGWPEVNDICVLDGTFDSYDYACTPGEKARHSVHPLGTDDGAFLHAKFAEAQGIRKGDTLTVVVGGQEEDFRVQGFALNSEFLIATANPELLVPELNSLAVMWVTQERLERVARDLGYANDTTGPLANEYYLRMTSGHEVDKAERALEAYQDDPARFHDLHIRTMLLREDTYSYQLAESDVQGFEQLTPPVATIVIIIAFSTIAITMERLVTSQRPVIGALRAIGTPRGAIVWHYLGYALVIGTVGALAGLALGLWWGTALSVVYRDIIGFPVLHLGFDAVLLGGLALLSVGACVAGGLRAALHAARVSITTAMRPSDVGRPAAWVRAVTSRVGIVLRIAMRNLTRSKRRVAFTVTGLTLSLVLTFSMVGVMDSSLGTIEEGFAREDWDALVSISPPQPTDRLQAELRGVGWVGDIETIVEVPVRVEDMDIPVRLVGLQDDSLHRFEAITGADTFQGTNSFLATPGFLFAFNEAEGYEPEVGDTLDLFVDDVRHRVRLDGIVQELFGATVYMPIATVRGFLGEDLSTGAYLTVASGRTADADELVEVPGFVHLAERADMLAVIEESFSQVLVFLGISILIGVVLGLVVVLNTSAVNLQERTQEHGTMKAIGFHDGVLMRVLAVENLVVGVVSAALGTILGVMATKGILQIYADELGWDLPYLVPTWHVVGMQVAVVLLAQVATLAARRHLRSLDLPSIVKARGT